ncbi:hypothetical protein [Treponema berlinense]|uniref:hypothetical protein n=1 Tax=Treponema berlinense TaxID=225004 RepID=UPI0026EE1267|nr:hypothetical protein [Treponema berlinense]
MKRSPLFIITVLFIFAQSAFCASGNGQDEKSDFSAAAVNIAFFDRTMYYPSAVKDNPVYVNVSIKNTGTQTLRFKLADDRAFSLDFSARSVKNKFLPSNKDLIIKRSVNQTVYFREISIEPGEAYSFVENVKDYIQFEEPAIYYLEMQFYPELYKSKHIEILSNRLSLEIRPSPSAAGSLVLPIEEETGALLKPESISPDKVVEQTIVARQKSLWNQYFLYMDIEEMMLRNSQQRRRYNAASADERGRMLKNYKADLMQNRIDTDIVAVPERFSIENTSYGQNEGTVTVKEWFKYPNFSEVKRYTYKVRQRDGIWQIYDYSVTNLGTE